MPLAHGGESGPNFEALVLALPMVVLGIILFVQKTAKPIVPVVLVLAGIAIGVGGLTVFAGDDHDAEASTSADNESYVSIVTGLCEAVRVAPADPERAQGVFEDRVHVPLHDLAADVGEADRDAAAALLEAKNSLESTLEEDPLDRRSVKDGLTEVLITTIVGLRSLDVEAPTC